MDSIALNTITEKDFSPLVGSRIKVRFSETAAEELTLTQVDLTGQYSPVNRAPFTLLLTSDDRSKYYPQKIYVLEHPVIGDIPLFMVPLGPDTSGMRYQIVMS